MVAAQLDRVAREWEPILVSFSRRRIGEHASEGVMLG